MSPSSAQPTKIPGSATAALRFARLSALATVGFAATRCLHTNKPWVGCRDCETACPQACLTLGETGVTLSSPQACSGCGQCAVACPTSALIVEGFRLDGLGLESSISPTFACQRQSGTSGQALRVPCIGGVAPGHVLRRLFGNPSAAMTGRQAPELTILDDGQCTRCSNARSNVHPIQGLKDALDPYLTVFCAQPVQLMSTMLPKGNATDLNGRPATRIGDHPAVPKQEPSAGRRAFFSGFGRVAADAVIRHSGLNVAPPVPQLPAKARPPIDPLPALQLRDLLDEHAKDGSPAASACLPAMQASTACCLHGVCARACPTGALALSESRDEATRSLRFDAWRCIGCGICTAVCPEKALTYSQPHWRVLTDRPDVLASIELATCRRCGEALPVAPSASDSDRDPDHLCDRCAKASHLARSAFALLGRSARPLETGPPAQAP